MRRFAFVPLPPLQFLDRPHDPLPHGAPVHVAGLQHGADAATQAALRADVMLEHGDMDGQAVWKRIVRAVEELQRKERREGESAH